MVSYNIKLSIKDVEILGKLIKRTYFFLKLKYLYIGIFVYNKIPIKLIQKPIYFSINWGILRAIYYAKYDLLKITELIDDN